MKSRPLHPVASATLAAALCLTAVASATPQTVDPKAATGQKSVPEPSSLWQGPMHGDTPATARGATVIDAHALARLIERDHPVMIDVANLERKPASMAKDMPWTPFHPSIPGATWMPGAGVGTPDPAFAKAFANRVDALTGGDRDKPIVAFCHPQRWGSWNTARRLVDLGYHKVFWFPGGSEGWQEVGKAEAAIPDADWRAAEDTLTH